MRRLRPAVAVLVIVLATACSSAVRWEPSPPAGSPPARAPDRTAGRSGAPPAVHVVQAGETLYAIARRYGLSAQDLARWNQLGDGSTLRVGQRLSLGPPAASAEAAGAPPPRWQWPVSGPVLEPFGRSSIAQSGIEIGGSLGETVAAAADGRVVYAGSGLRAYGILVIVKHNETWLSAYGSNQALLVREGESVRAGQALAQMGEGPGHRPALHFEIRRNGEPVDPVAQLPVRPAGFSR